MGKSLRKILRYIAAFFADRKNIAGTVIAVTCALLLAPVLTASPESDAPQVVPDRPKIVNTVSGDGFCAIEWRPSSGARRYVIQKRRKDGTWKTIAANSGKDNVYYGFKRGRSWKPIKLRVIAVSRGEKRSEPSAAATLKSQPPIPNITSLRRKYMVWDPVPGAKRYEILRRVDGNWNVIGRTKSTSYYTYFRKKKYYSVRAIMPDGEKSDFDPVTRRNKNYSNINMYVEGDSHMSPVYAWPRRTAMLLGMPCIDTAVPGATMVSGKNSVVDRVMENGFKGAGLIVIRAGSNDYGHDARLGNMSGKSIHTYYGAYKKVLEIAHRDAPTAEIVLVTPTEKRAYRNDRTNFAYNAHNRRDNTLEDYRQAVFELAERYGCHVYDMKNAKGMNRSNLTEATIDLRHPSPKTNIAISDDFISYLKKEVLPSLAKPSPAARRSAKKSSVKESAAK